MRGLPALAAGEELPSRSRGAPVSPVISFIPLELPCFLVRCRSWRWLRRRPRYRPQLAANGLGASVMVLIFRHFGARLRGQWLVMAVAEGQPSTP